VWPGRCRSGRGGATRIYATVRCPSYISLSHHEHEHSLRVPISPVDHSTSTGGEYRARRSEIQKKTKNKKKTHTSIRVWVSRPRKGGKSFNYYSNRSQPPFSIVGRVNLGKENICRFCCNVMGRAKQPWFCLLNAQCGAGPSAT
jgi:hypothetical protein